MKKVRRDQEVTEFENLGFWKTFFLCLWGFNTCKHKRWVSGGYGAYCWRCMKTVEIEDEMV